MGNYSNHAKRCRVDFFKPSGKWYSTHEVDFLPADWKGDECLIHDAFRNALTAAGFIGMLEEFDAICLEPYHENGSPIMLKKGGK